jgi:phosphoribosyl 1,2-cyclic phosphodiesterase
VIGSSSKGNCYILESSGKKLLLECGVKFNSIKMALEYNFKGLVGCLLSHEHKDHCRAAGEIAALGIKIYTSAGTAVMGGMNYQGVKRVEAGKKIEIDNFRVIPFDVQHDCAEGLGYLINDSLTGETLLFATDTFYLKYKFDNLNYIMIECNYVDEILQNNIEKGFLPKSMYNRLLRSHFSLTNVKNFLNSNDLKEVRKIVLLHLSDGNSDAKRMIKEIEELTGIETVAADAGLKIRLDMYPF